MKKINPEKIVLLLAFLIILISVFSNIQKIQIIRNYKKINDSLSNEIFIYQINDTRNIIILDRIWEHDSNLVIKALENLE